MTTPFQITPQNRSALSMLAGMLPLASLSAVRAAFPDVTDLNFLPMRVRARLDGCNGPGFRAATAAHLHGAPTLRELLQKLGTMGTEDTHDSDSSQQIPPIPQPPMGSPVATPPPPQPNARQAASQQPHVPAWYVDSEGQLQTPPAARTGPMNARQVSEDSLTPVSDGDRQGHCRQKSHCQCRKAGRRPGPGPRRLETGTSIVLAPVGDGGRARLPSPDGIFPMS